MRNTLLFVPIEYPQPYSALFHPSLGLFSGEPPWLLYTQSLEVICSISRSASMVDPRLWPIFILASTSIAELQWSAVSVADLYRSAGRSGRQSCSTYWCAFSAWSAAGVTPFPGLFTLPFEEGLTCGLRLDSLEQQGDLFGIVGPREMPISQDSPSNTRPTDVLDGFGSGHSALSK